MKNSHFVLLNSNFITATTKQSNMDIKLNLDDPLKSNDSMLLQNTSASYTISEILNTVTSNSTLLEESCVQQAYGK